MKKYFNQKMNKHRTKKSKKFKIRFPKFLLVKK